MSLQKQQDLLARLYTDPDFQSRFLTDPEELAAAIGLSRPEAKQLASTAADEVRWFSDSLINKRLREVVKKLPLTHEAVGAEAFEKEFCRFASKFSPTTVKKNLEDALAFSDWLMRNELDSADRSLVRFESLRLRHNSFGTPVSVCLLLQDPRTLANRGIGVWIAVKGWSRLYFRPNRRD